MLAYFVRHGQSEGNKNGTHHVPETPLSMEGIKQATAIAKRLSELDKVRFDLIYTSSMRRAIETAEIINKKLNLPIEIWNGLSECGSPSEIRGKKIDDPKVVQIKQIIAENYNKRNWKYSDEETFDELDNRVKNVLNHLKTKHSKEKVLCVSHSQFIKSIVAKILFDNKLSPEIIAEMKKHIYMENTGITVCEYTDKYGWTLNTWNDSTHLN